MGGYISLGNYESNYKYMIINIIFHLINDYLFRKNTLEKLDLDPGILSEHTLIREMISYIAIFLFSILLFIYDNFLKKRKNNDVMSLNQNEQNSFKKKLIYKDPLKGKISFIKILIIIFCLFLGRQAITAYYQCRLKGLDFWMFEILFIYLISSKLMGIQTYKHQIIGVFFVLIFCSIMQIILCWNEYNNNSSEIIYSNYKLFIPFGLLIFLLITFLRAYATCKIKWIIDFKYVSYIKILFIYGIMGALFCAIACTILTFVPCKDTIISYDEMTKICKHKRIINNENNNSNKTFYYYESLIVNYERIVKDDKLDTIKNICLIIVKSIVVIFVNLSSILILKYLNPLFFICSRYIYYFLVSIIDIIISIANGDSIKAFDYLNFFAQVFAILGTLIYTELIELNFCNLNYNLKKNIISRSLEDASDASQNNINEDSIFNLDNDTSIDVGSIVDNF